MAWDSTRPMDPLGPPGSLIPDRFETIEIVGPHLRVVGEISLLRFNRLSDLLNHARGFVKLNDAQLLRRNGDPTDLVVPELMVNQDEITFVGQKEEYVSAAERQALGAPGGMGMPGGTGSSGGMIGGSPGPIGGSAPVGSSGGLIGGSGGHLGGSGGLLARSNALIGAPGPRMVGGSVGPIGEMDRPLMERVPRDVVIFTEGHTISGRIYLFSETDIETFVDSPDPRFVPLIDVRARSLADRRVISHFALCLVNRTQIMAAALREHAGTTDETGVGVD